jgi:hypothetical protein
MTNLKIVKPQKRKTDHRIFSSFFSKSLSLLMGHSDFIEVELYTVNQGGFAQGGVKLHRA